MPTFVCMRPPVFIVGCPRLREWLRSRAFEISGLSANEIEAKVMAECSNGSDFIRTVMNDVASKQGVDRWIDSTPTNIPHMLRISRDFPEVRFIHIIRDGRDVALSLEKRSWSRPLPWDSAIRGEHSPVGGTCGEPTQSGRSADPYPCPPPCTTSPKAPYFPVELNTEVRRKYLDIRKQSFLARNCSASGRK